LLKEKLVGSQIQLNLQGLYCQQFSTKSTCDFNSKNGCSWGFEGGSNCVCDNFGNAYNQGNVAQDNPSCPQSNAATYCFASNPTGHAIGTASSPADCASQVTQNYYYYWAWTPSTGACSGGGYSNANGGGDAATNGGQPLSQSQTNAQTCNTQVGLVNGGNMAP